MAEGGGARPFRMFRLPSSIHPPWPTLPEFERFYHPGYYTFEADDQEGKRWYWARYLASLSPSGRFLDVGCATSYALSMASPNQDHGVAGVEYSKEAAQYARETLNLEVRTGELIHAKFPAGSFDFIHVNNVLEHVTNPVELLSECRRLLAPAGRMYLSVPHGQVDSGEYPVFSPVWGAPFNHNGHILYSRREPWKPHSKSRPHHRARLYHESSSSLKMRGWWPRNGLGQELPPSRPRLTLGALQQASGENGPGGITGGETPKARCFEFGDPSRQVGSDVVSQETP